MTRILAIQWFSGLVLLACSGGSEERPAQSAQGFQQGQPGQQTYGSQPQAMPSPAPPPPSSGQAPPSGGVQPLGTVVSEPSALQNIISGALAGGAASLGLITGGELGPIEQGIRMQSKSHARGMKAEGQLMSAKLQQNGHAQGTLMLQPGSCYTVIGFAGLGVFKYQINLLTAPPVPPNVLAQSGADGVVPVVGPNEQCIKNPYPLPMHVKVDMHVVQGQGMVGAQAFKK